MLTMHRMARFIGMLAALGSLGLYIVSVYFNPYTPSPPSPYSTGPMTFPIALMMLLSVVGILGAWKAIPYLMMLVFLASFFPVGLYMLLTPGIFRWIGVFNLIYGLASVAVMAEHFFVVLRRKPDSP